jgi:hypothetical protein
MGSEIEFEFARGARPILWDARSDEHKENNKKPTEWLQIAEKLQSMPGLYELYCMLNAKRLL